MLVVREAWEVKAVQPVLRASPRCLASQAQMAVPVAMAELVEMVVMLWEFGTRRHLEMLKEIRLKT